MPLPVSPMTLVHFLLSTLTSFRNPAAVFFWIESEYVYCMAISFHYFRGSMCELNLVKLDYQYHYITYVLLHIADEFYSIWIYFWKINNLFNLFHYDKIRSTFITLILSFTILVYRESYIEYNLFFIIWNHFNIFKVA